MLSPDPDGRLPDTPAPDATDPDAPQPSVDASQPSVDAPITDPGTSAPPNAATSAPAGSTARGRLRGIGTAAALVVVAVVAGSALFLSGYSLGAHAATTPGTPAGESQLFAPFWDTYHAIVERYAGGPVDSRALVEGAIKGMVDSLGDPYSSYLTPEQYRQTLQGISGQFEGIGAEMGTQKADGTTASCTTLGPDCRLVVTSPIAGSPAEKAGLRPGDVVLKVDGTAVDGSTIDQVVAKVRGPKGTTVTLTIVRGSAAPFDVAITRDVIVQKEVVARDLAGGRVGYIAVTGFSDNAANDFVDVLRTDLAAGRREIILDLRGDPGGFVTAARRIASQFIASGPIYWTQDAQGNQVPTEAEPGGLATDRSIRLVVLIDKGSASASEIVAGALQDTGRATLVGQTSFGKGTVQEWQPLENDSGGFRLTIARWLTPNKRWIHHVGLTPDVPVTATSAAPGQDPVLDRALQVLGETAGLLRAA